MIALDELERRVAEKWATAAAIRIPLQQFDPSAWIEPVSAVPDGALPPDVAQFPREQWASYPAARTVVLIACENLLDRLEHITDEQWTYLCFAMQYGGKTRIA